MPVERRRSPPWKGMGHGGSESVRFGIDHTTRASDVSKATLFEYVRFFFAAGTLDGKPAVHTTASVGAHPDVGGRVRPPKPPREEAPCDGESPGGMRCSLDAGHAPGHDRPVGARHALPDSGGSDHDVDDDGSDRLVLVGADGGRCGGEGTGRGAPARAGRMREGKMPM